MKPGWVIIELVSPHLIYLYCFKFFFFQAGAKPLYYLKSLLSNWAILVYLTPEGAKIGGINKTDYTWEDEVSYGFPSGGPELLGPWYPMVAAKPAEAYLFHEDCWVILSQQFARDIDLDKLFEVCKDIPLYGREFFDGKLLVLVHIWLIWWPWPDINWRIWSLGLTWKKHNGSSEVVIIRSQLVFPLWSSLYLNWRDLLVTMPTGICFQAPRRSGKDPQISDLTHLTFLLQR